MQESNTTVITSASISESENSWLYSDFQSGLEFLGHSRAMLGNRVSFWLNVHGKLSKLIENISQHVYLILDIILYTS